LTEFYNKNSVETEINKTDIKNISNQLVSLELENKIYTDQIQALKNNEIDLEKKLNEYRDNFNQIDQLINSILATIKSFGIKFEVTAKINNNFGEDFKMIINQFLNFPNINKKKEINKSLKNIEDWVKISCFQIEKFEQMMSTSNNIIEDKSFKLKKLEKNIHELNVNEEVRINSEKTLSLKVKQLEDERKEILECKNNLETEFDFLKKKFNHLKLETKNKIEECCETTQKINEMKLITEKLNDQISEQDKMILNMNYQEKALQERIKIILKEKSYFETILIKLANVHPIKNTSRIVNEILNICDIISKLERDKTNIINKLNNIEFENSHFKSDCNNGSMILLSLKTEKEENMKVLEEFNSKLCIYYI